LSFIAGNTPSVYLLDEHTTFILYKSDFLINFAVDIQ